ncbi:MAG: hypothetical protein QM811_09605 [Pirellulales bacterium]
MLCVLRSVLLSSLVICAAVVVVTAQRQLPGGGPQPVLLHWSDAEFVFVGKLDDVKAGPVARSFPPIYHHTLTFTVEKVLRGDLKPGEKFIAHHAARQQQEPVFPVGQVCLAAGANTRDGATVQRIEQADDQKIKDVTTLCKLPLGWNNDDGKILSPWATDGAGVAARCVAERRADLLEIRSTGALVRSGNQAGSRSGSAGESPRIQKPRRRRSIQNHRDQHGQRGGDDPGVVDRR